MHHYMTCLSVHFSLVAQSCLTLCHPTAYQASLSITNSQSLLKLTSIASFRQCPVKSFAIFWSVISLIIELRGLFIYSGCKYPYQIQNLQIFFPVLWVVFSHPMSFESKLFLILMKSNLPIFSLIPYAFLVLCPKIYCLAQDHKYLLLCLSFIVLTFMKSRVHFELIFVYIVR